MLKKLLILVTFLLLCSPRATFAQETQNISGLSAPFANALIRALLCIIVPCNDDAVTSPVSNITPTLVPDGSQPAPTEGQTSLSPTPQASVPTTAPSTRPSAPSGSGSAMKLYNLVDSNCGDLNRFITKTNGCYERIENVDILTQTGANSKIKESIDRYVYYQCVGLAKTVTQMDGNPWNVGHPSACDYAYNPPPGFTFIEKGKGTIQSGDFPIWKCSPRIAPNGHIAVVTHVEADGATFSVVEASVGGKGKVSMSTRVPGDPWDNLLLGWFRKV